MIRWVGAACVMTACSAWGFVVAAAHKNEETGLRQLIKTVVRMENELINRATPLPQLLSRVADGVLSAVLLSAAEEMERQIRPDAASCMAAALQKNPGLPPKTQALMEQLAQCLGKFDLDGQLQELACVKAECHFILNRHCENQDKRLRSIRAMGVCAGAVLAILLI